MSILNLSILLNEPRFRTKRDIQALINGIVRNNTLWEKYGLKCTFLIAYKNGKISYIELKEPNYKMDVILPDTIIYKFYS